MNKAGLVRATKEIVAQELEGATLKDTSVYVDAVFTAIQDALVSGEKIAISGFGNFEVQERAARIGRNPMTGESIEIPASKSPKFKAGKNLKDIVNA